MVRYAKNSCSVAPAEQRISPTRSHATAGIRQRPSRTGPIAETTRRGGKPANHEAVRSGLDAIGVRLGPRWAGSANRDAGSASVHRSSRAANSRPDLSAGCFASHSTALITFLSADEVDASCTRGPKRWIFSSADGWVADRGQSDRACGRRARSWLTNAARSVPNAPKNCRSHASTAALALFASFAPVSVT